MITCQKAFSLEVISSCWIEPAPVGAIVPPHIANDGTGICRVGAATSVLLNRVVTPVVLPDFDIRFATPAGGVVGADNTALDLFYKSFTNPAVHFGDSTILNTYGTSDTGTVAYIKDIMVALEIQVWSPVSGLLFTTSGPLVALDDNCLAPNDRLSFANGDGFGNFEELIWVPGVGTSSTGFIHQGSGSRRSINSLSHAAYGANTGANYKAYYYNGVGTSMIYDPLANVQRIRINASDMIAGLVTTASIFTYTSGGGLVVLGLPPGAISASDVWLTDSGLVIVQASNGPWFYSGGWFPVSDIISPYPDYGGTWTAVSTIYYVSRSGYAQGLGTYLGGARRFWCKFCSP